MGYTKSMEGISVKPLDIDGNLLAVGADIEIAEISDFNFELDFSIGDRFKIVQLLTREEADALYGAMLYLNHDSRWCILDNGWALQCVCLRLIPEYKKSAKRIIFRVKEFA